jgi:hypothetical protein
MDIKVIRFGYEWVWVGILPLAVLPPNGGSWAGAKSTLEPMSTSRRFRGVNYVLCNWYEYCDED